MRTPGQELDLDFSPLSWGSAIADAAGQLLDTEQARTLDIVARWLVRDLVERGQQRDATELTDAAFAVLHPELGGRRLKPDETALIADYKRIKREIVAPILGEGSTGAPTTSSSSASGSTNLLTSPAMGVPALGGTKVPARYKKAKNERGLARYSGDRLETTLRALMKQGSVTVSEDDLDTYQRIANVESSGGTQALNTWDSAVVSIGFLQLTLQFGELQRWIQLAPDAFARWGIEVDPTRRYTWISRDGKPNKQLAIKGAEKKDDLRWNGWAQRFYLAGLDPDIIAAELKMGRLRLDEGIRNAKSYLKKIDGGFDLFKRAYDASLPLRGLYQEAFNNKPVGARNGIRVAVKRAQAAGVTDPSGFYDIAKKAMIDAFVYLNDRSSGEHIVEKTAKGARGS